MDFSILNTGKELEADLGQLLLYKVFIFSPMQNGLSYFIENSQRFYPSGK